MQYISGNKMGQFRYVDNLNSNNEVSAPTIVYNPNNNTVQISGRTAGFISYIQHQELASDSYKNNQSLNDSDYLEMDGKSPTGDNSTIIRPANEYKSWAIPAYTNPSSEPLIKDRFYWVYAKVSKTTTNGTYLVETTARTAFEDSDYYYLVVGGLNSEHDGIRGWSPLFGFTEILPGQITTGLIRSSDGNSYFDLAAGIFHVGNIDSYLDWDSERLAIHNARLNITRSDGVDAIDLRPDGSGMLASNNIFWDEDGNLTASGLIQSALVGRRFIIDPDSASLIFYDNNNTEIGRWNYNGQWGSTVRVVNGNINTSVTPTVIIMTDNSGASSILGNYLAGELVLNATGSKRVRFDTTSQTYLIAQLSNLPTSSSGLASGSLYRSGSQVMIVP